MSSQIEYLLQYQKVDEGLLAIEKELAASAERKNWLTTKNFLTQAPEKLAAYEAKAQRMEKQLQVLEASYNEIAETLEDFDNIDDIIDEGGDISFYKKSVLQTMDKLRSIKNEIASLQKNIQATGQEYQDFKKKTIQMQDLFNGVRSKDADGNTVVVKPGYNDIYKAYKAQKNEEGKVIQAELDEIAKNIDPAAMAKYREKRSERIFPVLCPIRVIGREQRCSKCGMGFPISSLEKIKDGKVVECDNCHRILYTE